MEKYRNRSQDICRCECRTAPTLMDQPVWAECSPKFTCQPSKPACKLIDPFPQ
ncbi:hypothetical protein RB3583 [Rhodopirellula baltica SH 1]|uniref:Uncharacterized protein n=1 Tax=Rhodopirellula baltica (strain DSM 10527 / NCIMB 13988 / SH1) TaxID=243090 RepID=Q7UU08_RHOBA|nr:hypothetical protein RB3583 [Rhodopirellula baltica SH 1]